MPLLAFLPFSHRLRLLTLIVLLSLLSFSLKAEETIAGHRIHFQVSEQLKAENDLLKLSFVSLQEGKSSQNVIEQINQQMHQALQSLENLGLSKDQLLHQTGNYQIQPISNKQGQITHWRGQQSLEIEIFDLALSSQVLGALQNTLVYQNLQFALSDRKRAALSQQLLNQALKAYQTQAAEIAEAFKANHYRLEQTSVEPARAQPLVRMNMAYEAAAPMMADVALASGSSDVMITVRGTLLIPFQTP
ncbi:MAG: SIMPL domain-containing protein [Thiotrichales bacterium]|nr:SIMPL domain-containing protein [Thiotrichales bacterium]